MFKFSNLSQIGSILKVDISRLELSRFNEKNLTFLKEEPLGKVVDYKMTDGRGIGFVLELKDGSRTWFFDYELEKPFEGESVIYNGTIITDQEKIFSLNIDRQNNNKKNNSLSPPRLDEKNFSQLLNPLNFISWLLFSLKDVF